MSFAAIAPPADVAARVETSGQELRITLLRLGWRSVLRALAVPAFATLFFAIWTAIVAVIADQMWQTAPVVVVLFLTVGAGFLSLMSYWLWATVCVTAFPVTFGQTATELTIRRLGTRRRLLSRSQVSVLHGESQILWVCLTGKWKHISFPGRPRRELEWLAETLASHWQIPSREPLAENEVPVRFRSVEGKAFFRQSSYDGTIWQDDAERWRAGRLRVEPGRMTLRSDEYRIMTLQFVSGLTASKIARVLIPFLGLSNPGMPKVMLDDPDWMSIDEADPRTLRITVSLAGESETIEIASDDPTILPAAVEAFWSG